MEFLPTAIPDVVEVVPDVFPDERGYFYEGWEARKFAAAGIPDLFVQDNFSRSSRGILRGLHYQIQRSQGKLIRVTRGEVFDVAVDIRLGSSTFGRWVGVTLTAEEKHALWIPPGFAHGFYVVSDVAEFQYKCTDFYAPEHERTILWNDRELGITWPIPDGETPMLSAKDSAGAAFRDADVYD